MEGQAVALLGQTGLGRRARLLLGLLAAQEEGGPTAAPLGAHQRIRKERLAVIILPVLEAGLRLQRA